MRILKAWLIPGLVLASAVAAYADTTVVDCSKKSLAEAVRDATDKNPIVVFSGVCAGPILITIDGLTLRGVGTAVIDGAGGIALTVAGASRVSLIDFAVTNGLNGIVVRNGAHISLSGVNAHDNSGSGILIQSASSAILTNVLATGNGGIGLAVDDGAGVIVSASTVTANVTRDLQLTFGSRATVQALTFGTYACDATVLLRGTVGTCPH
jgi:hypothetical protein